jgi:uncharacterized repeat protein (TIGR01451 family)
MHRTKNSSIMLNKLLANLPFNPSLMDQVAFYGKRVRAESSVRRIGLVFVVLALIVQMFAVISPARSSADSSPNDLINGGVTQASAVAACQNNIISDGSVGYGTILNTYGISCADVAAGSVVSLRSTDDSRQLFSMGHTPENLAGETPVTITPNNTLFWRYLWAWDTGAYSTYTAIQFKNNSGATFFILYNCGNLVSIGLPQPQTAAPLPPSLSLTKTTLPGTPVAGSAVAPGTLLGYRMYFNNTGGTAQNVIISDPLPANTTYVWAGTGGANSYPTGPTQNPIWQWNTITPANGYYTDVEVRVNPGVANGTSICNVANISSAETGEVLNKPPVCVTVQVATPTTPAPTPTITPTPTTPTPTPSVPQCPYDNTLAASSPQCKACVSSQTQTDIDSCLVYNKSAANLTQNVSNADGTTAQAGDVIQYTLSVNNTSKATAQNFVISEDLSDVLDYADPQNLYGGAINNSTNFVSWPAINIAAGQTATQTFTVKIKDPIPTTPQSTSDPGYFNHTLTNTYGNTVIIKLPTPVIQTVAQTTQTSLPNTGPGSSILIAGAVVVIGGYFVARSRLLAKETDIIRRDVAAAGNV